ncbi:type II secretion system protein [Ruficoccus amylovorans]|uniref:Type II secretion system protein n=1 Tax=Ruficoccus amylovorans TaxID=1804625 RepID=A0A842HF04_9BACT|nr:type II secretion system protein [Ruficoccus amylovorans]MBC2593891.1 type II secretion system protein [Ruficoccus amylovorans]
MQTNTPAFVFRSRHAGRPGFSLIELLTVIAVIAVLGGILIATVNRVRDSARLSKSQSNLRQVTQTLLIYTMENGGRLPYAKGNRNSSSVPPEEQHDNWIIELRNAGYNDIITLRGVGEAPDSVMFCPMALACRPHSENASYNWAMNVYLGGERLSTIDEPGLVSFMMNSRWVPSYRTWGQTEVGIPNGGPNRWPDFPYPVRSMDVNDAPDAGAGDPSACVSFLDGRVELVPRSKFPEDVTQPFWSGTRNEN